MMIQATKANAYILCMITIAILFPLNLSAQFHLILTTDNANLRFLKSEKKLKLEFLLDSFGVSDDPSLCNINCYTGELNTIYYHDKPQQLKINMMESFEAAFNKESNRKKVGKRGFTSELYTYIIRVTPIWYYTLMIHHDSYVSPGMSYSAHNSIYLKCDYRIEILDKTNSKPIATLTLENLSNKHPMSISGARGYVHTKDDEININMARAGLETSKYIFKLIRKSKEHKLRN